MVDQSCVYFWFDVTQMCREVIDVITPLVRTNGNAFTIDLADDLGQMLADEMKVRQTLFNLLSNACKFTENGQITLAVSRTQGRFLFVAQDTGVGMTPEQIGRVFQPFTQADHSTTREFGGTGLGLTITQRFCQMMGGDIAVTSQPEEGSTSTMFLPVQVTAVSS